MEMANIVDFKSRLRSTAPSQSAADAEKFTLLFFTGVRYERLETMQSDDMTKADKPGSRKTTARKILLKA